MSQTATHDFRSVPRRSTRPAGHLRVALNMASTVLAFSHTSLDKPAGVTVDISGETARRPGTQVDLLEYASLDGYLRRLVEDQRDLAFLARDPQRPRGFTSRVRMCTSRPAAWSGVIRK